MPMTITSTAFLNNEYIPVIHTCEGENISPPLTFSEVPIKTQNLILIVDDPDAPGGTFTHWLLYGMSPATMQILQNDIPETGKQGTNDFGVIGYGGPCPPSDVHRYFFTLYALAEHHALPAGATRSDVENAIQGSILEMAELIGLYKKTH
jgi:Raf kinase inhibitor-like YbhB/YbcL family protein